MAPIERVIAKLALPAAPQRLSVSVRTAAKLTALSPSTIQRLVRDGRLKSRRVRNRRLISYESLRELVA